MFFDTGDKKQCCGCYACVNVCPESCIDMREDGEGFMYPQIDVSMCINCMRCRTVCPFAEENVPSVLSVDFIPQAYTGVHKDAQILEKSASGGAFSSIVDAFCDGEYAIFGVEMDDKLKVKHSHITDKEDMGKFRKSKYVQSDVGASYSLAKRFLVEGKKVLFSGTPCQIAALRLFLGKKYEGLCCVDLVCHGVPNQRIFDCYISEIEKEKRCRVEKFSFRYKLEQAGECSSRNVSYLCGNNTIIAGKEQDSYLAGFHSRLYYRPSCYSCLYARKERASDLTIADCWSIVKLHPGYPVHKGISSILINTQKGYDLLPALRREMEVEKVSYQWIVENTGQLLHPSKINPSRERFFANDDWRIHFRKNVNQNLPQVSLAMQIWRLLPHRLRKKIKGFLKRK